LLLKKGAWVTAGLELRRGKERTYVKKSNPLAELNECKKRALIREKRSTDQEAMLLLGDNVACKRDGFFDRTPYEFTRRSIWLGARLGHGRRQGLEQQASI
jgi:hypothetical protein